MSPDPAASPHARLIVLLSGSGRTLENILARIARGQLNAAVAAVVASKPCRGLDIARDHAIPAEIIPGNIPAARLDALVAEHHADLIVLAGYLRLVPVTPATRGRIVNIHPALLPAFGGKGMHGTKVHQAVIDAARRGEVTESGCTVHLVDEHYDTGPAVLQMRCPVSPDDTPDDLARRVFALELEAYPAALQRLIEARTTHA